MGRARAVVFLSMTVLLAFSAALPCMADTYESLCRRADGTEYVGAKCYCEYLDPTRTTCFNGAPWCLTTRYNGVRLRHWHRITNFSTTEQADADRACEYHYGEPDASNRLLSATTSFNCHAYALSHRSDVWNVGPQVTLNNDFTQCTLCGHTPQVGDVVKYTGDHTAVIDALTPTTKVISKWGAYGKYRTGAALSNYGYISSYWREKP